jgi:hypothetical protein
MSDSEDSVVESSTEQGEEVEAEVALADDEDESLSSGQFLRSPDLLTPNEASALAATGESRLVVWVGEEESGKTTLSAELYERHRDGRASTKFAGSHTLLGFEERIHPARAESNRIRRMTKRTVADPDEREILHLAVSSRDEVIHLLISDIPGELFRQMRDHELSVDDMPLLRHAEKLVVLVDGAWIADPGRRPSANLFARQLIAELANGGLPAETMDVALMLTKLDEVMTAGAEALGYWEKLEEELLSAMATISPDARAFRTAAEGIDGGDDGMKELMDWLLAPPPEPEESTASASDLPSARMMRLRQAGTS